MISINKNAIEMTRGDTLRARINIYKMEDGRLVEYVPQEGDSLKFAVKSRNMNITHTEFADKNPLIQIVIPTDTLTLEIQPNHTKRLGFGEYVYDIELTMADGTIDTFINAAKFVLRPEVC